MQQKMNLDAFLEFMAKAPQRKNVLTGRGKELQFLFKVLASW
jgi:hypothetical protein